MRIALYCRVSTSDGSQDTQNQIALLRAYCATGKEEIVHEYIDNASAKNGDRVEFPGGVVDLERCTDGSYWVHVLCNQKEHLMDREGQQSEHGKQFSRFSEARLHMTNKHTAEADLGDFENPGLYDVALRVEVEHV